MHARSTRLINVSWFGVTSSFLRKASPQKVKSNTAGMGAEMRGGYSHAWSTTLSISVILEKNYTRRIEQGGWVLNLQSGQKASH